MSVRECFKGSTCGAAQQQTYLSSGEDCPQRTTASLLLVKRHSIQRKRCVEMCLSTQICQGLGLSPSLPLSNTHTHTHSFNQRHHCCCSPAGTERDALMLVEAKKSAGIAWRGEVVSGCAWCKHILATELEIMLRHLEQKHLNGCKVS